MKIQPFFDTRTYTITYVVYDEVTRDAVVVDPVLDYEPAASKTWTESADEVITFIRKNELTLHLILETHAHADHLSGARHIRRAFPDAKVAIGRRITEVQRTFKHIFGLPEDFPTNGEQFDLLLDDGQTVTAGTVSFKVIYTPGHTPACASYLFEDAVFTGDALFMPDVGTGRCDFPGGSASDLYHSVHERLYNLPDDTRVMVGHDYPPEGREVEWEATIGTHKATNKMLRHGQTEAEFVSARSARDATLAAPRLLFQSVQVNVDGGRLPRPDENEIRYLRIPINAFRPDEGGDLDLQDV